MDRPDTREALGAESKLDHATLFQSMSKAARRVEVSLFDGAGEPISPPAADEEAVATVYLKQLNLLEGGIGCALWDAAIILARVLWANVEVSGWRRRGGEREREKERERERERTKKRERENERDDG